MTMSYAIKPSVMNVLCGDPLPARRTSTEYQPQPQAKSSIWSKVKGLFKKTWGYCLAALAILPPVINAVARYKEAVNRSEAEKNSKKAKG
jgi:hypothetical protein